MTSRPALFAAALLLAGTGRLCPQSVPGALRPAAAQASAQTVVFKPQEGGIRRGDMELYAKFSGIATAQDVYDVYSPFDGRIEEVIGELFDFITPKTSLARMVSSEMAAMIDYTGQDNRAQMEKRWKGVYKIYDVNPDQTGIISAVHTAPKKTVTNGERLFSVARKILVIGRNTERLYYPPRAGMTAAVRYARDPAVRLTARVTGVVPLTEEPGFYRLWLETDQIKEKIRIGHQFDGDILLGKASGVEIAPRQAIVEKNGRKYLMTEIETGLMNFEEAEITRRGDVILLPELPAGDTRPRGVPAKDKVQERTDGKSKKKP
ncbi:MAG: hypothetical protein FD189_224 [Elusimicrobia bacterium]|nr:MAG: hypothetical protein FD154_376 [Elusimicrobiota bacterium]KAF0158232.1 MAG: hypothetical protein FD189_224 [Elusimicrobiota bacterium]